MRQVVLYSIFLLMVACGGGGGSSPSSPDQGSTSSPSSAPSPTPTPTPTPTPSSSIICDDLCFQAKKDEYEDLYEYFRQDGLGTVSYTHLTLPTKA